MSLNVFFSGTRLGGYRAGDREQGPLVARPGDELDAERQAVARRPAGTEAAGWPVRFHAGSVEKKLVVPR